MQLLVQQLAEFKALTDTPNHSLSILSKKLSYVQGQEESKSAPILTLAPSNREPIDNNERIDWFLSNLQKLHEIKDAQLHHQVFNSFDLLKVQYNDDQIRRILNGNGMNQFGLFEYAARKEHQKDVLKLLTECLDV
jgi:hypothetical protein